MAAGWALRHCSFEKLPPAMGNKSHRVFAEAALHIWHTHRFEMYVCAKRGRLRETMYRDKTAKLNPVNKTASEEYLMG